jgi:putative SOS response-associated peptidase YedK
MASNKKLFSNLKENAGVVIDNHLDTIEVRIEKLEKKERWRDILALVQEYREWGQTEQGEDYNMMWLENLNNYKHLLD